MRSPTRAELEKLSYSELRELAAELAEEDEEIKKIRRYFTDEIRRRSTQRALGPGEPAEGQIGVAVQQGSSFLVARVKGEIFVLDNRCPHRGFPLHYQGTLQGYTLTCGFHGGQFDVRTGACVRHPTDTYPCEAFQVRSAVDGTLICELKKDHSP